MRVHHPRAVRRHEAGPADLTARLLNTAITGTGRRGKYLWLTLDDGSALVVHLGMSGQMLLGDVPNEDHLRIAALLDDGTALSFVDQRTFGGWMLADMVTVDGTDVPVPVAHLARDPLDPLFDRDAVVKVLRRKHSEIKRQLLDQTVVSGIGNIYADEALWRAKINGARLASSLTRKQLGELLDAAAEVMAEALGQGGTSFDSLYVNVNGESGYFDRSLDAYGREGEPCRRCGAVMRREKFMNRSSFYCPKCQPRPRVRRVLTPAKRNSSRPRTRTSSAGISVSRRGCRNRAMTELWVERTGVRRYTGRSSRGAEVLVGNEDVEGVFTPGELMKIALAACSGMASDAAAATAARRRLPDDDQGVRPGRPRAGALSTARGAHGARPVRALRGRDGAGTHGRRARDRSGLHRRAHPEIRDQSDV